MHNDWQRTRNITIQSLIPATLVRSAPAAASPGLTCGTSSDLLQQIGWEEAELPPRADLQVAVDLLAFLHYNLGKEEQRMCGFRLCDGVRE